VIDVAPTILEAIGLPERSGQQHAADSDGRTSLVYTFEDAKAKNVTPRSTSRSPATAPSITTAVRTDDPPGAVEAKRAARCRTTRHGSCTTRARTSACERPRREEPAEARRVAAWFLREAEKHHVLPMDDRVFERLDAASVGRPT